MKKMKIFKIKGFEFPDKLGILSQSKKLQNK